jgi:hypothetical protein
MDDADFLEAANELVNTAGMTADEANAYFAGIGYEPVYSTEDLQDANAMEVPNASTTMTIDSIGWSDVPVDLPDWFPGDHNITLPEITYSSKPAVKDPEKAGADMRLTSFSGDGKPPEIKGLRKKAGGSMNNYSSSNAGGKPARSGGGGGSKPKAAKKVKSTKKSEIVERYKEITDALDDVSDAMKKADTLSDRLYGSAKVKAMQT